MIEKNITLNINNQSIKLPRIRVGTDDFKTLLLKSDIFVDKSLMIQALFEDSGEVILIARPRRFGKSLNMDMLRKFFEIEVDDQGRPLPLDKRVNHKLFVGGEMDLGFDETKVLKPLKIASITNIIKRQGQSPVIYINFKDVKGSSYEEIEEGIKDQIIILFANHRYLKYNITHDTEYAQKEKLNRYFSGKLNQNDIKDSLRFLSKLLFRHFSQKVYILIDEYDTPINNSYLKFGKKSEAFE